MDDLARQRSAVAAVWRAEAEGRTAGDWAQLGDCALHTLGLAERHWNGCHVSGRSTPWAATAAWFADRQMPYGVLVPSELDVVPPGPHVLDQPVMLRDLTGLPALPDLDLRWDAGDEASAVQAEVFEVALGTAREFVLPKLVNRASAVVTAFDAGTAVATATLVAVEGVAAVYGVATLTPARGRGLGRAVTLAVLHEGLARGCDLAFLNPSDEGYGVYARLGFTDALPFRIYAAL